MNQSIGFPELPMGFSMALAQNPQALARFAEMTEKQRMAVINHTHAIGSKSEMRAFVADLAEGSSGFLN
ncbi:MAG: hypothetical protein ACOYJR_08800 [Acutalibacteraceae bacterium]